MLDLVVEGGGGGGQASRELLGLGCCLSGPGERPQVMSWAGSHQGSEPWKQP